VGVSPSNLKKTRVRTRVCVINFAAVWWWFSATRGASSKAILPGELTFNDHFQEFLPEEVRPHLAVHRARLKAA
jgi:hypothetical protein